MSSTYQASAILAPLPLVGNFLPNPNGESDNVLLGGRYNWEIVD